MIAGLTVYAWLEIFTVVLVLVLTGAAVLQARDERKASR